MRLYFPNSGHLQNFGGFARRWDPSEEDRLEFSMHESYVSVHPIAIAMAAAAQFVRDRGGTIETDLAASDSSIRYLDRMKLTDILAVDPELAMVEHASEGRFIPVTQVADQAALNSLIVDMVPLLHASPSEAGPIKYVITELVRNVLEHAASPVGAMVCAQYYADTERLSVGVADFGIGIRKSISRFHPASTDLDGINLALRPGVTGATARLGGMRRTQGLVCFSPNPSRGCLVIFSWSTAERLCSSCSERQNIWNSCLFRTRMLIAQREQTIFLTGPERRLASTSRSGRTTGSQCFSATLGRRITWTSKRKASNIFGARDSDDDDQTFF